MRPDKFRRRQQAPKADHRLRLQIAQEAARRLYGLLIQDSDGGPIADLNEAEYYAAKRKAAAVLGRRIRPGDLPSNHEVREAVLALRQQRSATQADPADELITLNEAMPDAPPLQLADHFDRFEVYRIRLIPLENVKQRASAHPEGDVLYHSLQVFELAKTERPMDEEFLLAALLHDVGRGIDSTDHITAGLDSLGASITERTRWLITHLRDARLAIEAAPNGRPRRINTVEAAPEELDDLLLLAQLDLEGRVPGAEVGSLDEALDYLRGLDAESYLDESLDS